ncbi:MAG: hypothetical protein ABC559_06015 [Candidatus Methanosuratincola petrocarbonis]
MVQPGRPGEDPSYSLDRVLEEVGTIYGRYLAWAQEAKDHILT